MTPVKEILRTERLGCLAAAALFLVFLLYSAPHRVHHVFESDQAAPCAALSAAKSCHLQPAATVELAADRISDETALILPEVWIPSFSPSPFSQRAPPRL